MRSETKDKSGGGKSKSKTSTSLSASSTQKSSKQIVVGSKVRAFILSSLVGGLTKLVNYIPILTDAPNYIQAINYSIL